MILFYILLITFFLIVTFEGYGSAIKLVYYFDILYQHSLTKIEMFLIKKQIEFKNFNDQRPLKKKLEKKHE